MRLGKFWLFRIKRKVYFFKKRFTYRWACEGVILSSFCSYLFLLRIRCFYQGVYRDYKRIERASGINGNQILVTNLCFNNDPNHNIPKIKSVKDFQQYYANHPRYAFDIIRDFISRLKIYIKFCLDENLQTSSLASGPKCITHVSVILCRFTALSHRRPAFIKLTSLYFALPIELSRQQGLHGGEFLSSLVHEIFS